MIKKEKEGFPLERQKFVQKNRNDSKIWSKNLEFKYNMHHLGIKNRVNIVKKITCIILA